MFVSRVVEGIEMENVQLTQARTEAFSQKVLADITGTLVTLMACIGDRLDLFKHLAQGPATCEELAQRAQVNERYTREWLSALTCAGYIEYDPASYRFTLPPDHIPVLAEEGSQYFVGGMHQGIVGSLSPFRQLLTAFRHGGGVPMEAYDADAYEGVARLSKTHFENRLVQYWIAALPAVQKKLRDGVQVADIGCGQGYALIKLAQAFPNSRYTGFDFFAPNVESATNNAQVAGVADRVTFYTLDAAEGLPDQYDVITTFDVVHDAPNPLRLIQAIRQALRPDGRYICAEVNGSDKLEENLGTLGALFYSSSVLFCMTTSLASHGEGLGTLGMPETKLRKLCLEAGFSVFQRVLTEEPFSLNRIYEII